MPDPRATGPLPPDVAARVRAYFAAFLPPGEVDDALGEVTVDSGFWGDTDETDILAVAHAVLASRLRVATDVEVLVLNEEVGLSVAEIAAVLALPPSAVRRILDEALAVLADPEAPAVEDRAPTPVASAPDDVAGPAPAPEAPAPAVPALPEDRSGVRRSHRVLLLAVALGVVVVAVAAAWLLGRPDGCPSDASICVTEVVLTDAVDPASGSPGPDRASFALDEPVTLWFAFERQREPASELEVRWYRDGILLYATDVRAGTGDRLNVSLAGLWSDEPGRYRVEVAEGDRTVIRRDFRIEG